MENEAKLNSTDFRVASFSCYLKPRENKQSRKRFSHILRRASLCMTTKAVDKFAFPDLTAKQKQFDEKSRKKSFEPCHSETINKGDIMKNLERKMSVLTWDAIPKANDELMSIAYDDVASDASSDLFEIEIFSRSGSFAEFSSAYNSDYDEKTQAKTKTKTATRKKPQKTTYACLLGCKSQQSVKVAEPVYKPTKNLKH
ncbi:protein PHYTOCHROME KINASE SUBSTRATE 3-like [Helianthus annuus]|uniref:protein PHYTOCHROME KINASE SUBSTRATE 3-like n=1 Tax=Helianthus annuus TaxID=4232 RepID=UPI000B8FCB7D|nr:protein PHYTOCHROME KINASE SUBSTRATE 3-like [Helianthus annuus]